MRSFILHLQSSTRYERIGQVVSFVARDASGAFAIWPGRAAMMTVLEYGLARFHCQDSDWYYLACPGAVLDMHDDQLFLSTRRYLYDLDYQRVAELLSGQLAEEETAIKTVKDHLQQLEQELFRRLQQLERRF